MKCPICNNDDKNQSFMVKELQQGFREEFEYIECGNCGCLFIKEIPQNINKYYDSDYAPHNNKNTIRNKIFNKVYSMYITDNKFIKSFIGNNVGNVTLFWNNLIKSGAMNKDSSILDIGCGDGNFLNILKKAGFKDLTGMDLFIDEKNMRDGIKIFQSALEDFNPKRKYDVIISNHAFEHMDNQLINLKCFENLIKPNGIIIIRIPVKSEAIWNKYGINWYQIDAPRHFFLHTIESFNILCNETNLIIDDIIFDSGDDCLINNEKYMRDISMRDPEWKTFKLDKKTTKKLKEEIKSLNSNAEGDQAIFVLKTKNNNVQWILIFKKSLKLILLNNKKKKKRLVD